MRRLNEATRCSLPLALILALGCGGSTSDGKSDAGTPSTQCGGSVCPGPVSGTSTGAAVCDNGSCAISCSTQTPTRVSTTAGAAACVDPKIDSQYCGSGPQSCAGGRRCMSGGCTSTCAPTTNFCASICVNNKSNPLFCGANCGVACTSPTNNRCDNGTCVSNCSSGKTLCGSIPPFACADLSTDHDNCGGCGNACADSQLCVAGACVDFLWASGCWECGDGNKYPTCCSLSQGTVCVGGSICPNG